MDFLIRYCCKSRISLARGLFFSFDKASITFSEDAFDDRASAFDSSHSLKASMEASDKPGFFSIASFILRVILRICLSAPRATPNPYSALSSKSELAQAGPFPSLFGLYGVEGAEPPYIEEQPVALVAIMRSPNSCVTSLR